MHSRSVAALGAASLGWGLAGVGVRALFIAGTSTFTVVVFRILFATTAVVVYGFVLAGHRMSLGAASTSGAADSRNL